MLKADAFGLQPFLRDYLPDGGLRSPLSMPRHPGSAAGAARCLWREFEVGVRIEVRPGGMHGSVLRPPGIASKRQAQSGAKPGGACCSLTGESGIG
jgi:hypothetical protein